MRAFKSSSESKSPTTNAATRSRGFLPIALAVLASAFSFTPTAVHADTPVKGFFADEEQAPAADAKAAVSATAAPQVQVQVNVTTDANAAVAVEGDEYSVDTDPSALTDFREPLEDYGTWSDDTTYGTVWYPDATVVGTDFAPYQTSGHWELDQNDDWMWVSDYDWGYIPFHYGRLCFVVTSTRTSCVIATSFNASARIHVPIAQHVLLSALQLRLRGALEHIVPHRRHSPMQRFRKMTRLKNAASLMHAPQRLPIVAPHHKPGQTPSRPVASERHSCPRNVIRVPLGQTLVTHVLPRWPTRPTRVRPLGQTLLKHDPLRVP